MALGLNKTKRRIRSVQSTQKITKAMEMVATVKLRRSQVAFENDKAYLQGLSDLIGYLFSRSETKELPFAKENEEAKGTLYILITSSLGLCAGYNANLFAYLAERFDKENDTLAPIGEKGKAHYTRDPSYQNVKLALEPLATSRDPRLVREMADLIMKAFAAKKYRKVVLIYTKYVNSLSFVPTEYQLLPVSIEHKPKPEESYCPPLLEPSAKTMIEEALPQYVAGCLHGKLVEAELSEQASRRTAMENANDNADSLLESLTIEYNKARQSAITNEIVEVVAGAAGQTK